MRIACAAALLLAVAACDESQVWHEPQWTLSRMQRQGRIDPFDPGMAAPPPFTVARGDRALRPRPPVTRALLDKGRDAFDRVCAACHGIRGDGESVVASKMLLRRPPSLMEERLRGLSDAQLHDIIERGYGLMPAHAGEMTFDEGWATVSYVRALQLAQGVRVADLPADMQAELAKEAR